ncbi:phosphotransferase [Brachybacterium sp. NBEC-018]|uniref:phosphotransferase enzyme family protein n=1 Tax=Brachybacterium sp. NBEC-018 TaxID=2996004 RepID=UPI0021756A34|nr:phosphotransferase [Brachybacterium sp. NBEC-018]UVY82965.1 phosphotransferase [Brachybacterium sp. NBEC-018]
MDDSHRARSALQEWDTVVGRDPRLGERLPGRELWPVLAEDGKKYYLKGLGKWRNLPLADECRVQHWLSRSDIAVMEYLLTDRATSWAGSPDDPFVLMPRLPSDALAPSTLLELEGAIGQTVARLHRALAAYPWSTNSYTEQLAPAVRGDLRLPADLAEAFGRCRENIADAVDRLQLQLVHGDLTPDNVLLGRSGELISLIDLDHLPQAPRAWDLAKYLSRRLRRRWRRGAHPGEDRAAHLRPFLEGYHQESPLDGRELAALPGLVLAANVLEVSYSLRITMGELERRRLPDHDEVCEDAISAARWHLGHVGEVDAAVRAVAA